MTAGGFGELATQSADATENFKTAIIRHAITADVQYVARYVSSTVRIGSPLPGLAALWMAPFLALFIHESSRKTSRVFPELSQVALSPEVGDVIARSRNALKLFEDRKRGIDGQVQYFREK